MTIVDCVWELANIGKRTCEITLSSDELIEESALRELCAEYEYIVVKIGTTNMYNSLLLGKLGFSFAETQISISKKIVDKANEPDFIVDRYRQNSSLSLIQTEDQLNGIIQKMSSNMFTTDRIYLDPYLGAKYSLQRYSNWMKTEFAKHIPIYELRYKKNVVGFIMYKRIENVIDALLGGVFENYQNMGLGLLLPLVPYLIPEKIEWYRTRISSNNLPVWMMYERLHYQITNFEYIFIKHNDI